MDWRTTTLSLIKSCALQTKLWIVSVNIHQNIWIESSEYWDQFSKIIADEKVKAIFNKWISHIQNEETGITVIKNMNRRTNSSENELLGEGGDTATTIDIKISAQLKKRTWKKQNKKLEI